MDGNDAKRIPNSAGTAGAIKRAATGAPLTKTYTAAQLRALISELKLHIMGGHPDVVIQEMMGITVGRYNELKKELYRQEKDALSTKTTEDVYLEYTWNQQKCIQDLEAAIVSIPETQPNALIGAIKTRSDILDKILKMGQDMGVLNKAPERKVVVFGHVVANMNDNQLRSAIIGETKMLQTALDKYGEVDMDGNPIDAATPKFSNMEKSGFAMAGPTKAAAARASRQSVKRNKVIDVDEG